MNELGIIAAAVVVVGVAIAVVVWFWRIGAHRVAAGYGNSSPVVRDAVRAYTRGVPVGVAGTAYIVLFGIIGSELARSDVAWLRDLAPVIKVLAPGVGLFAITAVSLMLHGRPRFLVPPPLRGEHDEHEGD